jgi:hypothetical protein
LRGGSLAADSPRRIEKKKKKQIGLNIKCPLLMSDFDQNWNVSKASIKLKNIRFYENPSSDSPGVTSDRHTDDTRMQGKTVGQTD